MSNEITTEEALIKLSEMQEHTDNLYRLYKENTEQIKRLKKELQTSQAVVNRIQMIIHGKENEIRFMEDFYPNVSDEFHDLHHSWKSKLDDLDMFKRLLF